MDFKLEVVNPVDYPKWDNLLLSSRDYSFFHSSYWAKVLYESYNYQPVYFTLMNEGKLSALIPVMSIKSILTGKRGVSLPFTDCCEPIILDKVQYQAAIRSLIEYGKSAAWKYIEIRGGTELSQNMTSASFYYGHTLELAKDAETLYANFRDSNKRNINKALKQGVRVNIHFTPESIEEFSRLNRMTRKEHGLPPQPDYFFDNVYKHIISKEQGIVVLASYNNVTIAGAVYFHFGNRAVYKYGASDKRYQCLRANNLVMWEAIKWYSNNGYKLLCFGRTEPENAGLRQYKNGWGTQEHVINYYKYDLKRDKFVTGKALINRIFRRVFRILPIPIAQIVGSTLYRYVG